MEVQQTLIHTGGGGGGENARLDILIGRNTCLIITFLFALHVEIM